MSSYPQTSSQPASASIARPATLLAAIIAAAVAGLAALINGIMVIAAGPDIMIDIGAKAAGMTRAELEAAVGGPEALDGLRSAAESDYQILKNRAWAALICGALLLIFGLLMRKAAMWARILVTVSALATAGFSMLTATKTDEGTGMMIMLAWVAVIVCVVAIVAAWLPANSRYAKAVR